MASYNPPSEYLPIFDNSVFTSSESSSGGLTLAQANALYLRKTFPDTCTALETFSAGISTTFLNSSGDIKSDTKLITNNTESLLSGDTVTLYNNQTNGVLNIGTNSTKTGNINIGTSATGGQASLGSNSNTQTNIYGGAVYLANATTVNGSLLAGAITGTSLSAGSGTISTTGTLTAGGITGTSVSAGSGTISTSGSMSCSSISGGAISGTTAALNGQVSCGSLTTNAGVITAGAITGTSLATSGNGNLTLGTGNITSVKDITASGTITGTIAALSAYLTIAAAASTYATITQLGNYLTTAAASTTYLSITTAASTYLTQTSAASIYATITQLGNYLTTAAAASTYLSITTAASTYLTQTSAASIYATISQLGNYLTTVSAASTYLSITTAASTYLTQTSASSTYATIIQLGDYLTTASASTLYLTITAAASTYATIAQLGNYLTTASAASTYLSITNAASTYLTQLSAASTYLSITNAASTYLTIANAASTYLTIANATSTYLSIVNASTTYLSIVNAASTYLSQATASITYATIASLANYLTITSAAGIYAPKTSPSFNTSLTLTSGNVAFGTGNITTVKNITSSGDISTAAGSITGATVSAGAFSGIGACDLGLNSGNITSCNNITSSGTLSCNTINTTLPANNLNICNGTNFTGEVNIATQPTATCDGIFLGNSFNPTTVNGNLTVLGTLTAGGFTPGTSALNTITSVLPGDNVQLYDNQTTGTISLGGSATRTGSISIGTNPTTTANGVFIGNTFNPTTVNGNLTVLGTLTAGSSVTSFDTLVTSTTTTTANLYNNQTTGIINLGNIAGRTGVINIGNNATQNNVGNYRFTGANIETTDNTITDYSIMSNVTNANIRIAHAQDSGNLVLGNNKTSGDVNIMNSGSSSGNINMGNNLTTGRISMIGNTTTSSVDISSSLRLRRGAIDFITGVGSSIDLFNNILSGVTLNIGGSGTINIGQLTAQPINIGGSGIVTLSGTIFANLIKFVTNSIEGINNTGIYNLFNNLTTGTLNICNGLTFGTVTLANSMTPSTTVKIGYDGLGGIIRIGNVSSSTYLDGLTYAIFPIMLPTTPPSFIRDQLGYSYNYPDTTFTGLTSPISLYVPSTNVAGGDNYFKAGKYFISVSTRYRYTGNPTALNVGFYLGASYGTGVGVVPTGSYPNLLPNSPTFSRTLIAGSNNQDFGYSHSFCAILPNDGFINIFNNVPILTRTGGSVIFSIYGTIHRIG